MKIVIPIDGSPQSTHAVQSLTHFMPPEELVLVHALHLPDLDHPMITPELRERVLQEVEKKLREDGEAILNRAQKLVPPDHSSVQRLLEVGSPAQVILDTAKAMQADLIIMGARGLGPIQELVLGSVSHRVVLHAPCSVMIMKSSLTTLRSILLPIQGDEDAEKAVALLAKKPFREAVAIEAMTVWPQPQIPWPVTLGQSKMLEERALEHAQQRLDRLAERLAELGYSYRTTVGLGDPAFAILEQARERQVDLIMMGSHGRRGLSRFFLGSVSHAVLHRADRPVLIVR